VRQSRAPCQRIRGQVVCWGGQDRRWCDRTWRSHCKATGHILWPGRRCPVAVPRWHHAIPCLWRPLTPPPPWWWRGPTRCPPALRQAGDAAGGGPSVSPPAAPARSRAGVCCGHWPVLVRCRHSACGGLPTDAAPRRGGMTGGRMMGTSTARAPPRPLPRHTQVSFLAPEAAAGSAVGWDAGPGRGSAAPVSAWGPVPATFLLCGTEPRRHDRVIRPCARRQRHRAGVGCRSVTTTGAGHPHGAALPRDTKRWQEVAVPTNAPCSVSTHAHERAAAPRRSGWVG